MADGQIVHNCEVPENALIESVIEMVSFVDSEGDMSFAIRMDGDTLLSHTIGLLEIGKNSILKIANQGDV